MVCDHRPIQHRPRVKNSWNCYPGRDNCLHTTASLSVCIFLLSHHVTPRRTNRWQETDYRDFRINFIQFMRTPPAAAAADGPELVPVEIVAESESTPGEEDGEEAAAAVQESVQQPVVVDPAVYEGARATEKVRAWPVQEEEEDDEPEDAVVPATAAAATGVVVVTTSEPKKSISSYSLSDSDDTSPPTPPSEEPGTDGGESDESIETAAGISCAATTTATTGMPCAAAASCPEPTPPWSSSSSSPATTMSATSSPCNDSSAVGFSPREGEDADYCPTAAAAGTTGAAAAAAGGLSTNGGDWDEQETNCRGRADSSTCSLGWSSVDDEGNDADEEKEEEPDYDGSTIRMGRSFSNLETARRGGAGLSAIVPGDSSDGDGDESSSNDGSEAGGGRGGRPRALSLDGWFTCGLENGVDTKTYETHDHAGRLRDLVLLVSCHVHSSPPLPRFCVRTCVASIPCVLIGVWYTCWGVFVRLRCLCLPFFRDCFISPGRLAGDAAVHTRMYSSSPSVCLHRRARSCTHPMSLVATPLNSVSNLPSPFCCVPLFSRSFLPSSRQAPIPAVCATPPTDSVPKQQVELNDALRRLGVTFNVSVDKGETPKAADESTGPANGNEAVSSPGGFVSSPAAAAASRKMAMLPSPGRPSMPTASSVKSQQGGAGHGRSSSLTTPIGFRVS